MSRASGRSFAAFFPQAPSVIQDKKRLARSRQKSSVRLSDQANGEVAGQGTPSPEEEQATQDQNLAAHAQNGQVGEEDKQSVNGEPGDLLNGVGSASSHTSTHSSVFSAGGTNAMSRRHGAGAGSADLTPVTVDESSPPQGSRSPNEEDTKILNRHVNGSGLEYSPISPRSTRAVTPLAQNLSSEPQERPSARPPPGEIKGQKAIYDPETEDDTSKVSKEMLRRGPRYRKFGEHEHGPPPDPRLAMPGYRSGNLTFKPSIENRIWKFRPRPAPYTIAPYSWDQAISVGPGPPTSVVVTGFDPFTPDAQLRALFSSYGEIAEVDNKTDPTTGVFLGVCSVRYRDSRGRGQSIAATIAAKRAEKECSGQRLGTHSIRVERDRGGKKCRKYAESVARRHREQREKEDRLEVSRRPPPPTSIATETVEALEAPPPNAPKGPSGKAPEQQKPVPRSVQMAFLIEQKPILEQIKRKPYIFVSHVHVPVMGTTIPHLKKRLKFCRFEEIRCDDTGYYVIFEDHKRGEEEAARCFREYNKRELFTYQMIMECQQYGNPNYERTPSPERVFAEKRKRQDNERQQKEDEMDWEEEKKQRALNLDPVMAAMEQLRLELKDKVMADIKTRIGAPALYDYLDPARHIEKRRKLGIADPSEQSKPSMLLPLNLDNAHLKAPSNKRLYGASITRIQREEARPTNNVFLDERRRAQRKPKRKVDIRSLHQRLQDLHSDDESDDEQHTVVTRDTDEHDSRSASRMSSIPPSDRDGQTAFTPNKRRRIVRSETPQEEDSGEEELGSAPSTLDRSLLRKDMEDMTLQELQKVIQSMPQGTKHYKRAKAELITRKNAKDTDNLFRQKDHEAEGATPLEQNPTLTADDIVQSTEIAIEPKSKKSKNKKKSKKQIFEEREAAKAAADLVQPHLAPLELSIVEEAEKAPDEEEEDETEEGRAEVEWGVSTDRPRRTVEDEPHGSLDIDGWQHLLKDDEDIQLLREALADQVALSLPDVNAWAYEQKAIKALNHGRTCVDGYYVPNVTGSARTEGYKRILESEKSKYLPHRIKVAQAREQREKEVGKPAAPTESARQAKLASTTSTASSRTNRANNRTQVKDITNAKQNIFLEGQQTDAIRFNQLKKRKKLVKFDRSAIHGWGLYAEQDIAASDMIIEYVGEKVRQAVANIRELKYDRQGMGSSYLFRIDDDTVIDATKKGGIARFINHSCAPNCTAKIVRVDDGMRIAIYAKTEINKGDELTYDYKFEREFDSDMRVPCLCGSEVCKGFLN